MDNGIDKKLNKVKELYYKDSKYVDRNLNYIIFRYDIFKTKERQKAIGRYIVIFYIISSFLGFISLFYFDILDFFVHLFIYLIGNVLLLLGIGCLTMKDICGPSLKLLYVLIPAFLFSCVGLCFITIPILNFYSIIEQLSINSKYLMIYLIIMVLILILCFLLSFRYAVSFDTNKDCKRFMVILVAFLVFNIMIVFLPILLPYMI